MKVRIFADGACSGNPGPGGWACILEPKIGEPITVYRSGREPESTNNKMEIFAAIEAMWLAVDINHNITANWKDDVIDISHLLIEELTIVSDSLYVIKIANGEWKPKENKQEWDVFDSTRAVAKAVSIQVNFEWVKGHNKNILNEFADDLAKAAIKGKPISTI